MKYGLFVKKAPPNSTVLRRMNGIVSEIGEKEAYVILSPHGQDKVSCILDTSLLKEHGIDSVGQKIEYTFLKVGKNRRILLRPINKRQ